jgi:prefoldin beta subunit
MTENISKKMQERLAELQEFEQKIQTIAMQKHSFQAHLLEIENALGELKDAKEAFKIVGSVVVSAEKEDLIKDLTSKKEVFDLRLDNLEKQEKKLRDSAEKLQQEVMGAKDEK